MLVKVLTLHTLSTRKLSISWYHVLNSHIYLSHMFMLNKSGHYVVRFIQTLDYLNQSWMSFKNQNTVRLY